MSVAQQLWVTDNLFIPWVVDVFLHPRVTVCDIKLHKQFKAVTDLIPVFLFFSSLRRTGRRILSYSWGFIWTVLATKPFRGSHLDSTFTAPLAFNHSYFHRLGLLAWTGQLGFPLSVASIATSKYYHRNIHVRHTSGNSCYTEIDVNVLWHCSYNYCEWLFVRPSGVLFLMSSWDFLGRYRLK